jgi:SAM-dependent methyltransferase
MQVLSVQEFYARVAAHMEALDPGWAAEQWPEQLAQERATLRRVLGPGGGRPALDLSCGSGLQAVALASLGWQVVGLDLTETAVREARRHAREAGLEVALCVGDMGAPGLARGRFNWVVSCYALDNLTDDADIRRALRGAHDALRPGGRCYLRLRDFDNLMQARPRYEFREERTLPHGRVIRLEDWLYESETHAVFIWAFLHEDRRREGYRWSTEAFALRRRALRKQELREHLTQVGFGDVTFLPQASGWHPYEVMATK